MIIHKEKSLYMLNNTVHGVYTECGMMINLINAPHNPDDVSQKDELVNCPKCLLVMVPRKEVDITENVEGIWFVFGLSSNGESDIVPYPIFWSKDELEARRFSDKRMTNSIVTYWTENTVWSTLQQERFGVETEDPDDIQAKADFLSRYH